MVPIKFDQIGFNGYVPYQIMHFEALKKEKQKCDIDLDRNFETHVCHDLT
ncbi:MAG: hypothetical protein LBG59_08075 [Candidatus Peribacteria bacterium]|jgi:hypothetical protein|nr:hypothetical protein [Candidatus Peribacteria bacterium]